MSKSGIEIEPGCLVEFLQENQPVLGWVQQHQGNALKVLSINKRDHKVPLSRILPWVGPAYPADSSREEALERLKSHHERRQALFQAVDAKEIWELAADEVSEGGVDWFAGLLWQEPDPDQTAALGHALLQLKTHFKFQPPRFKVYDSETVQRRLAELEAAHRRRRFLSYGREFLKYLWAWTRKGSALEPPELPEDVACELKAALLRGIADPEDREIQELWAELGREVPWTPHQPLLLAQAWGIVPPHHNHLLDQAGYTWGDEWSRAFQEEIEAQQEALQRLEREPEPLVLTSVDSSSTRDIDDAFSLSWGADGCYQLTLALACPVLAWPFGSELDREVAHRGSSLYLPEGSSHMLPETLGAGLYSLHAGQTKPVLLLDLRLDADGSLQAVECRQSWARVRENATYQQVETELEQVPGSAELQHALALADRLRSWRLERGAVIMEQEDPILRVRPGPDEEVEVQLEPPAAHPKAQLLVSEFMILANRAVSIWAGERGVPLVHRTQDISLSRGSAGVWRDPVDIFRLLQEMSSSRLDLQPGRHASLGLEGYAPITSPLRRYIDFVNMHQVVSFLEHGAPARSAGELQRELPALSARLQAAAHIQRTRTRYWKLLYLKRWCKVRSWTGILVGENGQTATLSLPREQLFVRAPSRLFESKRTLGQRYQLRLGNIDPLNNDIKVQSAWGDEA